MPDPEKWQLAERIVGLLEKSLVPGASVKVNEKLPNLKTGLPEQFDAVIRSGPPLRQTLTVVEVQKRGRKVEINDFRGWCVKREDVGAQHLICVSEKGFPVSVVEEAKLQGNTVRLLTLEELEGKKWPFQVVNKVLFFTEVAHKLSAIAAHTDWEGQLTIGTNEPVFKRAGSDHLLTPMNLSFEAVGEKPELQLLPDGSHDRVLEYYPPPDKPLSLVKDGKEYPAKMVRLGVTLTVTRIPLPLTCAEYVPVTHEGAIAYALVASGTVAGKPVSIRVIFIPEANGFLRYAGHEIDGLETHALSGLGFIRAVGPKPESVDHL